MADGGERGDGPPTKKAKLAENISELKYDIAYGLDRLLSSDFANCCLIKLLSSNGDDELCFTQATCHTKYCSETEFFFPTFFQFFVKKFVKYLSNQDCDFTTQERQLIENLESVFKEIDDIAKRLVGQFDNKQETAYFVQLAEHLLRPLTYDKYYKIDHHSRNQLQECQYCMKNISGEYGDTSIGNEKVWHGSTDILLGKSNDVPVTVSVADDDKEDDDINQDYLPMSSLEIKCDSYLHNHRNQLIAEAIVFGFLRNKMQKHALSLTPTIGISKKEVRIYFYDAKYDYLLESFILPLFVENKLNPTTVVALWLTINYPLTCSGLTTEVYKEDFHSDFLKNFDEKIKIIYKNDLRFGNCMKKERVVPGVPRPKFAVRFCQPLENKHDSEILDRDDQETIYNLLYAKRNSSLQKGVQM